MVFYSGAESVFDVNSPWSFVNWNKICYGYSVRRSKHIEKSERVLKSELDATKKEMKEQMRAATELSDNAKKSCIKNEKYIKEKPEDFDQERILLLGQTPGVEEMMDFIKALFDTA